MANQFGNEFVTVGTVALVKGKIHNFKIIDPIDTFLDDLVKKTRFVKEAPFRWIGLIFLYGIKNALKVKFQSINQKDGELPISLELDMKILQWADQNNLVLLYDIFMIAALEALIQVGQKYKLPLEPLVEERAKYGNIPNTIEECIDYKSSSKVAL